jgi:DNA-directed RNA polymerase specialized sigma24 family protein
MDVDLSGRHVGEDEPLYAIREISADVADRHELDLIRRGLSPQEAHVLVSRERGQRTVDIAERMGVTQQAVTDAARRGRVKLAALSAAKD